MRTTLDIPGDILRRAKARAALDGITLKDLVTRYIEVGLVQQARHGDSDRPGRPRRSPPPLVPEADRVRPIPALTRQELAEMELDDDIERLGGPA
jgi:hypothetical protein